MLFLDPLISSELESDHHHHPWRNILPKSKEGNKSFSNYANPSNTSRKARGAKHSSPSAPLSLENTNLFKDEDVRGRPTRKIGYNIIYPTQLAFPTRLMDQDESK